MSRREEEVIADPPRQRIAHVMVESTFTVVPARPEGASWESIRRARTT